MKLLCIDLYCGLGGWAEGFLAEGYDVVGFDIERHRYPKTTPISSEDGLKLPGNNSAVRWSDRPVQRLKDSNKEAEVLAGWEEYPGQLVLQDVLTLHGSQFRNAAVIVASPPCQAYSYRAMPWKRAKALPPPDNSLFDACFRIQREASEAAGHHIPIVVENVKGAQPWVGRAKAHYGSFYLWGDVENVGGRVVAGPPVFGAASVRAARAQKFNPDGTQHGTGSWFAIADSKNRGASVEDGSKVPGMNFHEHEKTGKPGRSFQSAAVEGVKLSGLAVGTFPGGGLAQGYLDREGIKNGRDWFGPGENCSLQRCAASGSTSRKAASAQIAKIPFPLASYIAQCYLLW